MKEVKLPKIALGAWAWGDDGTFGTHLDETTLEDIFDTAMDNGLNLWDTAYAYGMGTSEKVLSNLLATRPRKSYLVSDKLTPQCVDAGAADPVSAMLDMQLGLLGIDDLDIYWIHNTAGAPRWITLLAEHFEGRGDAPMIGVSNHNLDEIKQADEILRAHGLKLGAVQNHYSLLERSSEDGGILAWCKENGVSFWAYMVLEQGALSGKYDTNHPMPEGSARAQVYNPVLGEIENLNVVLADVAEAHGVATAQVPIAWAIAKGCMPIVGVTKKSHVEDAVKAASMQLSDDEMERIEQSANALDINLVRFWEKKMA